ncbi:hypothetical protein IUY40_10200 [Flavobacterium sp. ALJ2]|uniref:hypothetical protein n=1 Tax=Flavobacterium sp. ALJ2 TaxID=2786960 RepID=UPI00189F4B36|nr:hypothetical protein [Flavobacterium sp. ALJ2]MBF7091910.1 hypothetical protein [Flavobacterium sp. ALJ2]
MLNVKKTYKPIQIDIDNEESDDRFFSLGFTFNFDSNIIPHNIGFCRDFIENPNFIYIEADDQIHGFNTKAVSYNIEKFILTLTLLDKNKFYWDGSKSISIELDESNIGDVILCLKFIFDGL